MLMNRRGLIRGLGALLAAPAIVRVSSLMPVSVAAAFEPVTYAAIDIEDLLDDIFMVSPSRVQAVFREIEALTQVLRR